MTEVKEISQQEIEAEDKIKIFLDEIYNEHKYDKNKQHPIFLNVDEIKKLVKEKINKQDEEILRYNDVYFGREKDKINNLKKRLHSRKWRGF